MLPVGCSSQISATTFARTSDWRPRAPLTAPAVRKHVVVQASTGDDKPAVQRSLRSLDSLDLLLGSADESAGTCQSAGKRTNSMY